VAEASQRLFVAVPVPPDALAACRALLDPVRSGPHARAVRWVRTENLHLTLRFLGEVPDGRVSAVGAAVREAAAGLNAFAVILAGTGVFPDSRHPRTIWLGIERGADELGAAVRALDPPLMNLGWPPETRPYRPHVSIARTDAAAPADTLAAAAALREAAEGWRVVFEATTIALYRSHLGAGPPRYEPLEEVGLRRA